MAKAIYIIKIYMVLHQLPQGQGIISNQERRAVERMAQFLILFYGKYFLQSAISPAAPRLDLLFWRDMTRYQVFTGIVFSFNMIISTECIMTIVED